MTPRKQVLLGLFLSAILLNAIYLSLACLLIGVVVLADPGHTLPPPEEIQDILTRGSETQKERLVEALGLRLPADARWGANQMPCMEYGSVTLHGVVLGARNHQAVLVAKPEDCEYQFVVVLNEVRRGQWTHIGTVPLLAKHWEPEVSFHQLVHQGESEIVVRNRPADVGTGMLQRNITIFKLLDGGLRVIFDEVESQVFAIPTSKNGQPENTSQTQESEFWLVDSVPGGQSIKDIVEKQVIRDHECQIVRWRIFVWHPELEMFQGVGTDGNSGEGKPGTIKLSQPNVNQ